MRRGGPPAHSAATPEFVELPGQISWTEIPNIWERQSRVHRAAKDQATKNQQDDSKYPPTGEIRTLRFAYSSRR